MRVHNTVGVLVLFLAVNLEKILEESGVNSLVEFVVGMKDRIFIIWDDIMVSECSFQVCDCLSLADHVCGMENEMFPLW